RALADAEALWQFLQLAAREHGEEIVAVAARQIARQPTLPPHLERAAIDAIPEAPGVYLFYGAGGTPLYVGKSVAMRTRVLAHFSDDIRSQKEMQLAREVRRIDWRRTAGELGALLAEARLVKELAPAYNRQLRKPGELCGFVFDFKRVRLAGELAKLRTAQWRHRGPLGIVERDPEGDASEVHVVHQWCYLGTARSDDELAGLLEAGPRPRFDYDHYKILTRHLGRKGVRVVELGA